MTTTERPLGVSIIAVLNWIVGVLAIIAGFGALTIIPLLGIVSLLLGAFAIYVGYGLWTLLDWAWMVAVILQLLNVISNGFQLLSGELSAVWGLIISFIVLAYLYSTDVKEAFDR